MHYFLGKSAHMRYTYLNNTNQGDAEMTEFFITRSRAGFTLTANGVDVGTFSTEEAAADMAVRFAQDIGATAYRIFF